ncbi:hypothetical protein HUT13_12550 [Streptomyces harbinensis]|uniref:hypothetical protein n=1 Tax=Streptomyces TaxID=1883 RepID=UPI000371D63B|nr:MULTISPECIES: hypothetical protein [Streptomyces]QKV69518.1 hypothetical protein HUT13_12550 [Streptomyces harbinensis]
MITSNPVGDWTWEVDPDAAETQPDRAAEVAVDIWNILAGKELAVPTGKVSFSARAMGDNQHALVDVTGLPLEPNPLSPGTALSHAVLEAGSLSGDLLVSVRIECPGYWLEAGVKHLAQKLFVVQVDLWKRRLLVATLETYSDAWLTMDTRDRPQPEVHAENAPRLAASLEGISALLGTAPTPGDPNRHATPTRQGFEDPRTEGFAYDDSWGTFEVPARSRLIRSRLPPSDDEYPDTTDQPVRYVTIGRGGQTLGYLWASTGDEAAGFEPRTAAGEAAFEAGAAWLLHLRAAHARGLGSLDALVWAIQNPPRQEAGSAVEQKPHQAPTLDALEELSGRY